MPLHKIPEEEVRVAEDLIFDRRRDGYDPLQAYIALFENRAAEKDQRQPLPEVPPSPTPPARLIVVDATVESLAPLLEDNPRGLLMTQDEGVAWVRGMGQYKGGRGGDRQFWLSNWSGLATGRRARCQSLTRPASSRCRPSRHLAG